MYDPLKEKVSRENGIHSIQLEQPGSFCDTLMLSSGQQTFSLARLERSPQE